MSKIMISPEVFWQVYSAKLNELKSEKVEVDGKLISVYCTDKEWTPRAIDAAGNPHISYDDVSGLKYAYVPEPVTFLLFGIGGLALRKKRRHQNSL